MRVVKRRLERPAANACSKEVKECAKRELLMRVVKSPAHACVA